MKIKPKYYAMALAEVALNGKSKKVTENFFNLLKKNGDTKKAKEIVLLAENMMLEKMGNKRIVLEMARIIKKPAFAKSFGVAKNDIVQEKINPDLIAGIKIIINGNKQLDFSLLKKINEVFK